PGAVAVLEAREGADRVGVCRTLRRLAAAGDFSGESRSRREACNSRGDRTHEHELLLHRCSPHMYLRCMFRFPRLASERGISAWLTRVPAESARRPANDVSSTAVNAPNAHFGTGDRAYGHGDGGHEVRCSAVGDLQSKLIDLWRSMTLRR